MTPKCTNAHDTSFTHWYWCSSMLLCMAARDLLNAPEQWSVACHDMSLWLVTDRETGVKDSYFPVTVISVQSCSIILQVPLDFYKTDKCIVLTHRLDLAQGLFLPPASHSGAGFEQAAGAISFTWLESKAQAALAEILICFIVWLCSLQQYCGSVQGCWSASRKDMGWMKVQDSGRGKRKLKCLWGWGRGQESCAK